MADPPLADEDDGDHEGEATDRRERAFRGISRRLAVHYLTNLGGDQREGGTVVGDGWRAELTASRERIGPTLEVDEVRVVFEGEPSALDSVIDRFAKKAMRAGG